MSIPTHHIIPEGEPHCIWMDAGVVAYKLCAFGFQCETCAFDAQLRSESRSAQTAVASSDSAADACSSMLEQALRAVARQELPMDRLYGSNHTWVRKDEDGSYTLGVDHFIGTMLSGMHSVACSLVPTHIKASEPVAWIVANGETLAVRSPVAGTITANNPALGDRSSMIHRDPYGGGWISRITPPAGEGMRALMTAEKFQPALKRDAARFEKSIRSGFKAAGLSTGTTMYDGGTALTNFEDVLGSGKYFAILEKFLRPRR